MLYKNTPVVTYSETEIDNNHKTSLDKSEGVVLDQNLSLNLTAPLQDSGIEIEKSLEINDTYDDEFELGEHEDLVQKSKKYKKPLRPCCFCNMPQTQFKRHVLTKHKRLPRVSPLLSMNSKEQDRIISIFRKEGVRNHNLELLKSGKETFMRERKSDKDDEIPVMCSGCKGFFAPHYKARHQLICPTGGSNLMLPLVSLEKSQTVEEFSDDFKSLLNTLQLDEIGNYVKSDQIVLMIGARSFGSLRRKKDKVMEAKKSVRARMRLIARIYLAFREVYGAQSAIKLTDECKNAADIFRRETITILGRAIDKICEKSNDDDDDENHTSIINQKSGLKINIFNVLKLASQFMIGYYLVENQDEKSNTVVQFLRVLKLFEEELFGDAYYDLNYRKNVKDRKPIHLPKDDDVKMLIDECKAIMSSINHFDHPSGCFIDIRSATATTVIIFNARRGGEPVRLQIYRWHEALNCEWVDRHDVPEDFNDSMLVTFQTGKGADHLVPVMFPPETHEAMRYLTNEEIRRDAGVKEGNQYIFASTQNSNSHASGWHCINSILERLSLKGALNATKNRHRVASLLAKLQLSEKEKDLIFKHFGHSGKINQNIYQAAAGTMQMQTTGQRLLEIHQSEPIKKLKSSHNIEQAKCAKVNIKNCCLQLTVINNLQGH